MERSETTAASVHIEIIDCSITFSADAPIVIKNLGDELHNEIPMSGMNPPVIDFLI